MCSLCYQDSIILGTCQIANVGLKCNLTEKLLNRRLFLYLRKCAHDRVLVVSDTINSQKEKEREKIVIYI